MTPVSAKEAVAVQIEQEIYDLEQKIAAIELQIQAGYEKVTAASDVRFKAWDKVEKSIPKKHGGKLDYADPKKVEAANLAERAYQRADHDVNALVAAKERYKRELKKLQEPSEAERRSESKERLTQLREKKRREREVEAGIETPDKPAVEPTTEQPKPDKPARKPQVVKPTAKEQGFPEVYLGPSGNFIPGADATAKHDLVCAVLHIDEPVKHKFDVRVAKRLLAARGWEGFVEKRQKSLEAEKARAKKAKDSKAA